MPSLSGILFGVTTIRSNEMEQLAINGGTPVRDKKIFYGRQWIDDDDVKMVADALKGDLITCGPYVDELEKELCKVTGAKYAVAVSNGTAALHCAAIAAGLEEGDEMITTPITFAASANCARYVGAMPVFADVDPDTYNIDPAMIEVAITPKTKAIMPVHLYGQPCDMDKIMDIAKRHDLYVIEDCCQAIGAEYKGKRVGTFGDIGCYSFYPTKNLGTMGDGGLITVNSENLKNRIVALRNHGGAIRYHHDEIGVNSRLDEIQAAILRVKLPYIDEWNTKRRERASIYNELFAGCADIITPKELDNTYCVYHQYTVKVPNRDEIFDKLHDAGIGAMLYYPIPLHLQKVNAHLGQGKGSLPITERNTEIVMSLPMFPELTREEQETVASTLIKLVEESKALV
jgi:dTDP-4-amino-4,6-dideoxygalactose transaminase